MILVGFPAKIQKLWIFYFTQKSHISYLYYIYSQKNFCYESYVLWFSNMRSKSIGNMILPVLLGIGTALYVFFSSLSIQGRIYWGARRARHRLPNNFSDFCFTNCNKTCSALPLCCHLHLPKQKIMVDLWAATWLRTSVFPGFHFGFELKNSYYVIKNI